jgi:signal transduction histidine kinase
LISFVSHDLRSPFNTIALWIENLKSKLPNELEAIEMIKKTALYGQKMVNNILDIEKMEINTHSVALKNTDLAALIKEAKEIGFSLSKIKNLLDSWLVNELSVEKKMRY